MTSTHVIVIGAGISGLSCARELTQHGFSVTVLDKARGPGGRASSKRLTDGVADLGAQYFTARDPQFIAEVETLQSKDAVAVWKPTIALASPGEFALSPDSQTRWVGHPKMGALAHALAQNLTVTAQSRVVGLEGQTIHLESGETLTADHIVVACPADQTQALLPEETLPEQAPCWAMWVDIDQSQPFDAAFVKDSPIGWLAMDSSKPGRSSVNRWTIHATPEWSHTHLEDNPAQVMHDLTDALRAVLPNPFALEARGVHRWRFARPWASGEGMREGYRNVSDRISICGDYMNGGRVEGAWLSGYHCARAIVKAGD